MASTQKQASWPLRILVAVSLLSLVAGTATAQRATAPVARGDSLAPGAGVWRNYDFVPGDTVWFATDFSNEPVGRFPASQLQFVRGNMQIVEIDSTRALEVSSGSVFRIALPRELPDDFSVEFEIKIPAPNIFTYVFFSTPTGSVSAYTHDYVYVGGRPGIYRKGIEVSNMYLPRIQDVWVPVKLQVDSAYSIMYVGTDRVAQVPTVNFPRSRMVEFQPNGNARLQTYIRNIVVAVGLNDLYKALSTKGEFSTLGILFDTDSDRLRPESTPVLGQLRSTLQSHADLRVLIEGHTDSQGDDAHNQSLSERRAKAVVDWLVAQGIAANRLSSAGKGESAPAADNNSASGRRQNRRVVVKKVV
jgi:outer membrane protein OmpA-like peptidoglycan-associated protein